MYQEEFDEPATIEYESEEVWSNDAVIVKLYVRIFDDVVKITGSSRRAPGDRFDPEVGAQLAYARAFEILSKKLYKRALGKEKHNEQMQIKKRSNKTNSPIIDELLEKDGTVRIFGQPFVPIRTNQPELTKKQRKAVEKFVKEKFGGSK